MADSGAVEIVNIKALLVGETGGGKTSMLMRYSDNTFSDEVQATVGVDFKKKEVIRDGTRYFIQFWDTAGQERYRSVALAYFKGAKGFILVFDITKKETFDGIPDWYDKIQSAELSAVGILVGNKSDLAANRAVSTEEATKYAESIGFPYYETSSKDGTNVKEAFDRLIDLMLPKPEVPEVPVEPDIKLDEEKKKPCSSCSSCCC